MLEEADRWTKERRLNAPKPYDKSMPTRSRPSSIVPPKAHRRRPTAQDNDGADRARSMKSRRQSGRCNAILRRVLYPFLFLSTVIDLRNGIAFLLVTKLFPISTLHRCNLPSRNLVRRKFPHRVGSGNLHSYLHLLWDISFLGLDTASRISLI